MNDLASLYKAHTGKVSDKWELYLKSYHRLFSDHRSKPIRLLEIGVQNGGSLEIWAKYFPNAQLIVGCDIEAACLQLQFDDPRIKVVVGDATCQDTEALLARHSDTWDIIIDDGSHYSRDIVSVFVQYFPRLRDGGLYVVEDLHCSYWKEFDGGLSDPLSAISFFKRIVDVVNHEHWGIPFSSQDYLSGVLLNCRNQIDDKALSEINEVVFTNSQCAIKKSLPEENTLGGRIIAGSLALVSTDTRRYAGTLISPLNQSDNSWSDPRLSDLADADRFSARYQSLVLASTKLQEESQSKSVRIRQLEDDRQEILGEIAKLRSALAARDETIEQLARERIAEQLEGLHISTRLKERLTALEETLSSRDSHISTLLAAQFSPAARLSRFIERFAKAICPAGSYRRRFLSIALRFADYALHHGLLSATRRSARSLLTLSSVARVDGVISVEGVCASECKKYEAWIQAHEPSKENLEEQRQSSGPYNPEAPLFSVIVPVYKIPKEVLVQTVQSVINQTWKNWELCIAYADHQNDENWEALQAIAKTDARIKSIRLENNNGISANSNSALSFALGEFVALLDHDDILAPWALHEMATRINKVPEADFLYSDKDSIDEKGFRRQNPLFKPTWSPEMLYSVNYLTHFNVMRRQLVGKVGGWEPRTDGAQDWDIFFRVIEQSRRVERVEGVHYHWRIISGSTATGISAKPYALLGQLRTIEDRLKRLRLSAAVQPTQEDGYRIFWHVESRPQVDVVLHGVSPDPARMLSLLVNQCHDLLASVTLCWFGNEPIHSLPHCIPGHVKFVTVRAPLGEKTKTMRDAILAEKAPVVMLLDLSIVDLSRDCLRDLIGWVGMHPEIGFSAGLVLLKDMTVVEAGRIRGSNDATEPLFRGMPARHWGPFGGPLWYRNVSAAADIALAFKRDQLTLCDDTQRQWPLALADMCSASICNGRRGVVVPHAKVYLDSMPAHADAWDESMRDDPYFHPAFRSVTPLELDSCEY